MKYNIGYDNLIYYTFVKLFCQVKLKVDIFKSLISCFIKIRDGLFIYIYIYENFPLNPIVQKCYIC